MEDIFEAALADDPSRIAAIVAETPGAAAQRMDDGLFVTEVTHLLYRGDTPADQQLEIVRLLLAAGATLADTDRNGTTVADRINSQALRQALAAGQL